jgi:hypothetical protein
MSPGVGCEVNADSIEDSSHAEISQPNKLGVAPDSVESDLERDTGHCLLIGVDMVIVQNNGNC